MILNLYSMQEVILGNYLVPLVNFHFYIQKEHCLEYQKAVMVAYLMVMVWHMGAVLIK